MQVLQIIFLGQAGNCNLQLSPSPVTLCARLEDLNLVCHHSGADFGFVVGWVDSVPCHGFVFGAGLTSRSHLWLWYAIMQI